MKTKTPTQAKTPFAIDPKPMTGATSARAGLSAVSRVVRSLGLPSQCAANVPIRKRQRGFNSGHQVESLILLHAAGGDCMDDMELLRQDEGLTKILGYQVPGPGCVGDFI